LVLGRTNAIWPIKFCISGASNNSNKSIGGRAAFAKILHKSHKSPLKSSAIFGQNAKLTANAHKFAAIASKSRFRLPRLTGMRILAVDSKSIERSPAISDMWFL